MINGDIVSRYITTDQELRSNNKNAKIAFILIDRKKDEKTYSGTKFFGLFQMSSF